MGVRLEIDIGDLTKGLEGLTGALERRVRLALLETATEAQQLAVAASDAVGAVDTGYYKARWQVHQREDGSVELYNDTPYAGVIEMGRRPGRPGPPLAPILTWVLRKLVPNGQITPKDGESMEKAARRAAFAIRAKIHFRGTKPRRIFAVVRDEMPDILRAAIARHLG